MLREKLVLLCFQQEENMTSSYDTYKDFFDVGVELYLQGKWKEALTNLHQCKKWWPTDQVCESLLDFMKQENCKVPANWKGFRQLPYENVL